MKFTGQARPNGHRSDAELGRMTTDEIRRRSWIRLSEFPDAL